MDKERRQQIDGLADPHGGASERVLQEALREVLAEMDEMEARWRRCAQAMSNAQGVMQSILDDRNRLANAVGPVMRLWSGSWMDDGVETPEERKELIESFRQDVRGDHPPIGRTLDHMYETLRDEEDS